MRFTGRRICPTLALRFTPVGVRPTSPRSMRWYNVFGPTTPPKPRGGGPSRETQTIASWVSAASPRGQRCIARPSSSTISPLTTGPAASLHALFGPFLAGASPTLVSTASKLLSCNQTRPRLRYSTAVASRKKACSASTVWFAASPRTFCSTRGLGANRNIPDATPNSAPEGVNRSSSKRFRSTVSGVRIPPSLAVGAETQMRKLRIIEHISLDGVIQHSADDGDFPYSDWTAPYRTPAGRDAMLAAYGGSFDLVLGRPAGRLSGPVGHGEALLCGGNPATLIRACQHASISVRHHLQCLQGRRAFEDRIARRRDIVSEYRNAVI
jgi:hypothetical protein